MAFYNKIGLLILSSDHRSFLVCEKHGEMTDFILPGGKIEKGESDLECLKREIQEELGTNIRKEPKFIGEYVDVAAGEPTRDVMIRLYRGDLTDEPHTGQEIKAIAWLARHDAQHPRLSPILKNKIIPDLIVRSILT